LQVFSGAVAAALSESRRKLALLMPRSFRLRRL
jgi:hypothetical protein